MRTCLRSALAALLLPLGGLVAAAETSMAVQVFSCNLKDGATQSDFWEAADQYRTAMGGLNGPGLETINVYALMPFRAAADADFLWLVASPNLNALGTGLTTYYNSESGRGADAAFAEISDCSAGIVLVDNLHQGEVREADYTDQNPEGIYELFGCNLLPGKTAEDLQSATAYWQTQIEKINSKALDEYSAWLWTPFRASGRFDFAWLGFSPDLESSMRGATDYLTSEAGQAADERFASMSRCGSGLWNGYAIFGRNTEAFN